MSPITRPELAATVLDTEDVAGLAEFYRELLGWEYAAQSGPAAEDGDEWRTLVAPSGTRLSFQRVDALPRSTWPGVERPQQIHLDLTVPDAAALRGLHPRVVELGATLLHDASDDPDELVCIYADPAGHPFCVFVPLPAEG